MSELLIVFLFAIPLIFLAWIIPQKYVLKVQIAFTSLFLLYISTWSFFILAGITLLNFYWLKNDKFSHSLKLFGSISILSLVLVAAKVLYSINDSWILPLGMSYYTFRNLHYTIDVSLGKIKQDSLLNYLAYNFFLPVLIIGPINKYNDFIRDWNRRRFNIDFISLGLERILFGTAKIFILGNYIFSYKVSVYLNTLPTEYLWHKTYLESLRVIFNGYYQFAGYSDIAIGLSLLLGFRINENFNNPFWSTNMREFWTRYHMSLSGFGKDYIYEPIAAYFRKPITGILITMLIIALWHQINLQYLIWGAVQTIGIYLARYAPKSPNNKLTDLISRFFVINFCAISSVLVLNASLEEAFEKLKIIFLIN
jgi:alginate O-acetyltransferase complex protein AlgI